MNLNERDYIKEFNDSLGLKQKYVQELEARVAKLESWKESAILTLNDWDAVAEKVPHKPSNLGRSKSAVVGEYIEEAIAKLAAADRLVRLLDSEIVLISTPNHGSDIPSKHVVRFSGVPEIMQALTAYTQTPPTAEGSNDE